MAEPEWMRVTKLTMIEAMCLYFITYKIGV